MPLRRRLGLVAASAVGIAVVIAACVCYFVVRSQLRDQVDSSLRAQASEIPQTVDAARFGMSLSPNAGGPAPYGQLDVPGNNPIALTNDDLALPVTSGTEAVITGRRGVYLADITLDGSHLREITVPVEITSTGARGAVQLARPLDGVDHILSQLRVILFLVLLGGVGLAAVLGRLAAKRVLKPLSKVSETAQLIAETDDLTRRIDVHEDDEVGQLATRFNAMLARLEHSREELDASVAAQRQLVADASHELRTPVTSLRTNVEVLLASEHLDPEDRRRLLADVVEQSEELTGLVGDLIELARGDLPSGSTEDVRLDKIVEEAVARSRRNSPHVEVRAELHPVVVEGSAERLHRVVNNLLDNAARHAGERGLVDVIVDEQGIRVRDHGTGIDERDLPYIFDRFYRGADSRGRQGSGLGLAIVRQVVEQHGGSVSAANAPGGGAEFTIRMPTAPADAEASHDEDAPARESAPLF
jgi:two-component system sensor histidine kinase MprB